MNAARIGPGHALALLLPLALLAGAWASQIFGGLYPCEMCLWQRWPHYAAVAVAAFALLVPAGASRGALVLLAALLIAGSGAIGVAHAGVEYGWWPGFTACTSRMELRGLSAAEQLDAIMRTPLVRCDRAAWTLGGISLAGFNAIFSLAGAATIFVLTLVRRVR